ncbi:hypothetical protein HDZ31DRAFT_64296 [Schizophyllum fasciatum]
MNSEHTALAATRVAAQLPRDIAFHRTIDDDLKDDLDDVSERATDLLGALLTLARPSAPANPTDFKQVVDTVDWLLEGADATLDVLTGKTRPPQITVAAAPPPPAPTRILPSPPVDNRDVPFAYDERTHPLRSSLTRLTLPAHVFRALSPIHPSQTASTAPSIPPLPADPPSFSDVSVELIQAPTAFNSLFTRLRRDAARPSHELLLALDLEHHSAHSYRGFVCLLQLTTRLRPLDGDGPAEQADYLIDALALRKEMTALNEFTIDPRLIKVFHGAASDIPWLAENFGVHVVGMFDTYHAARALRLPALSLAHLLRTHCAYAPDKRLARSDWRVRPLPPTLLSYARSDTHFLPFLYDTLKQELLQDASPTPAPDPHTDEVDEDEIPVDVLVSEEGDVSSESAIFPASESTPLTYVLQASARTCLRAPRWPTSATLPRAALAAARRAGRASLLDEVFLALYRWRDAAARAADEGVGTLLPNSALLVIADKWRNLMAGEVGQTAAPHAALASLLAPVALPPAARLRAAEIMQVVLEAVQALPAQREGAKTIAVANPTVPATTSKITVVSNIDNTAASANLPPPSPSPTPSPADIAALFGRRPAVAASRSALFGAALKGPSASVPTSGTTAHQTTTALSSALFGGTLRKDGAAISTGSASSAVPKTTATPTLTSSLAAIAARVHASFGVAVPSASPQAATASPAATAEHAFVPAGKRQASGAKVTTFATTQQKGWGGEGEGNEDVAEERAREGEEASKQDEEADQEDAEGSGAGKKNPGKMTAAPSVDVGAIVAGAGAGRRKRKRTKGPALDLSADPEAVGASTDAPSASFDFASVPNILDAPAPSPVTTGDKPKKKKRKTEEKGPHFRAPAPAPAEVRGVKVNLAHTFGK